MRAMPLDIGTIHFVGIGGIGMSGIAEVLHLLGYSVQGSDQAESANVQRLRASGIPVHIGHAPENLGESKVVVVSSAVPRDNPEVATARSRMIAVVRRAEMLAELMRLKWSVAVAGTHGKTTTTSLVAALLDKAGLDPTVINGGIINAYGTNARIGEGEWMVCEADESDGTFVKLPAVVAIVTNMDPEHLDHYGDFDNLRAAFVQFVENIPFYGFAVLCIDHPEIQAMIPKLEDRRLITYGFSTQADVRAENIRAEGTEITFDVTVNDRVEGDARQMRDLVLPMLGKHNVQNAMAAISVALQVGVDEDTIRQGLGGFSGVKRRFTKTGEVDGITIIDDYGHHPVEIQAVLSAARQAAKGKVIAVVEPHRYSRVRDLFEEFCTCFNEAHVVLVAPIYPAGEAPITGIDRDTLVEGIASHGHRRALALEGPEALPARINELAEPGDLVVCLGAGTITRWANDLPAALQALRHPQTGEGSA